MVAKVVRLVLYPSKDAPSEQVKEVMLLEGLGIQGDRHCTGGDRQISIMLKETDDWKQTREIRGLCLDKFHENILIEGLFPEHLAIGTMFKLGSAIVEIRALKSCYENCELYQTGTRCTLKNHGAFAAVLQGGIVKIDDAFNV